MYEFEDGKTYAMTYVDEQGQLSIRLVRVMEQDEKNIVGFCYNRMEPRSFHKNMATIQYQVSQSVANDMWNGAQRAMPKPVVKKMRTAYIPVAWRTEMIAV